MVTPSSDCWVCRANCSACTSLRVWVRDVVFYCRNLVLRERHSESSTVQRPVSSIPCSIPRLVSSSQRLYLSASKTTTPAVRVDPVHGRQGRSRHAGHDGRQQWWAHPGQLPSEHGRTRPVEQRFPVRRLTFASIHLTAMIITYTPYNTRGHSGQSKCVGLRDVSRFFFYSVCEQDDTKNRGLISIKFLNPGEIGFEARNSQIWGMNQLAPDPVFSLSTYS